MLDNLFIVESPLQAMVAVELSLRFEGEKNGVIYRLSGKAKKLSDRQIQKVVEYGNWSIQEPVTFTGPGAIAQHLNCRRYIFQLRNRFRHQVRTLFFGEFRSQWMHYARFAIAPEQFVLMDDGAATLTAKHQYIDKGVYCPEDFWLSNSLLKNIVKKTIYVGLLDKAQAQKPLEFASAFLKDESAYKMDFSSIRSKLAKGSDGRLEGRPKAYFFGSKYSEAGILSREYELEFIADVLDYYQDKGLAMVYCAHRDESEEKLDIVREMKGIEVLRPELPAELLLLDRDADVSEIGAAYSSVINNLSLMYPDKTIVSFRLKPELINQKHHQVISNVYDHYKELGIPVISL